MSATPTRRQQIDFSDRLYMSSSALIAVAGSSLQPTAQALQGKRVGVVQGSTQESYANAEWAPKNVTVVAYQTQDQIYQDLVTHRIDAAFQAAVQADFGFLKTPRGAGFALVGKACARAILHSRRRSISRSWRSGRTAFIRKSPPNTSISISSAIEPLGHVISGGEKQWLSL